MNARRFLPPLVVSIFLLGLLPSGRQARSSSSHGQSGAPASNFTLAAQTATPPPDPPGMIDGSKNPELIPDQAAYRAVLLAFAEPENPTDAQKARFHAKIAPAGLGGLDTDAFFAVLTHFRKQSDALHTQAAAILARNPLPHPDSVDYQTLKDISQQEQSVFAEAISAIPARLSLDGAAKLDTFIKNEKRGMKYVPDMTWPAN